MKASASARGYGAAHQRERTRWATLLASGHVIRCAQPGCSHPNDLITAATVWDLGHSGDRRSWIGPVHTDCNRRAGAINSNIPRLDRATTIREW